MASEGISLQEASQEAVDPSGEAQEAAPKPGRKLSRSGSSGKGSRKLAKVKKVIEADMNTLGNTPGMHHLTAAHVGKVPFERG